MAVRTRRSVFALGDWSTELEWYGKAVAALLALPLNNPRSWRYMGAVHGRMTGKDPYKTPQDVVPPDHAKYWDQCQHQTWFFLPWHRGYITAFEANVAAKIVELGGPPDWALPYWDYSANPAARILPKDFYTQKRPDGSANPLWNPWGRPANGDAGLTAPDVSLKALTVKRFAGASHGGDPGFAGPVTGFMHFGQLVHLPSGDLEETPHNLVHGQLGGLMADPDYAALDPIFWLHHANIDRLWERWRVLHPALANPTQTAWLNKVVFDLHDGQGAPITYTAQQMLDTTKVMHGYSYDSLVEPGAAPATAMVAAETAMAPRSGPAELGGANEERLALSGGEATTSFAVRGPPKRLTVMLSEAEPLKAYLNLEQITGDASPGNFDVYVAAGSAAPVMAGKISTFGLAKASKPDGGHGGNGLHRVLDITPLQQTLGLGGEGEVKLQVTVRRAPRPESVEPPPFETSDESVRIGRVSVYFA